MNAVGIYDFPLSSLRSHDKGCAIIKNDGEEIYAYEEAKFSSVKADGYCSTPEKSLFMGLRELNLNPKQIDQWVFVTPSPLVNIEYALKEFFLNIVGNSKELEFSKLEKKGKIKFLKHHDCHASMAGFTSPFKRSAILSMDGGGDKGDPCHILAAMWSQKGLTELFRGEGSQGLANFYGLITEIIGYNEEGKTSGLGAYGKFNKELSNKMKSYLVELDYFSVFKNNRTHVNSYNSSKLEIDSYSREKYLFNQPGKTDLFKDCYGYKPQDIAQTALQLVIERVLCTITNLRKLVDTDNLCLVGGLFNNVAINYAIARSKIFKNYHFSMAPGDAGLALGAAASVFIGQVKGRNYPLTAYLGPSFSEEEITKVLTECGIYPEFRAKQTILHKIASDVASGKIVGTFLGRAEYGPRSLGHRSILGDPRDPSIKLKINAMMKRRDWFMPYAPAILEDFVEEYISPQFKSEYMQIAAPVTQDLSLKIPSAIHADGTARVQLVTKNNSPEFYEVIKIFFNLTGCPVLLNTSFNRHGIATIATPRAALDHLVYGCVDAIAFDNFYIEKKDLIVTNNQARFEVVDETALLKEMELDYMCKAKHFYKEYFS